MYYYYIPISMVALSVFINFVKDRRADFVLLSLFVLFVVIISGLRFHSDVDYDAYVEIFSSTPHLAKLSIEDLRLLYGEAGYLVITSAVKSSGGHFFVVTLLASFIAILSKGFVAARLVKNASFVIALYLCLSFITIEFIQMRWAMATGVLTLAYYSLHLGRHKSALLLFAIAISFHYAAILFTLLSYFTKVSGYHRYFLLLTLSFLVAIAMKLSGFSLYFSTESDFYVVRRLLRYLNDPESSVGAFSFLKIIFYAVTVFALVRLNNESVVIKKDKTFEFLFRSTFTFLSVALVISFVPFFFFRAMVMADLFSILLICYLLTKTRAPDLKATVVCTITILFSMWCYLDVSNFESARRILPYESWIRFAL